MATTQKTLPILNFDAELYTIGKVTILKLPEEVNALVPSHGQVAVKGTIDDYAVHTVLEPDGHWGHWIKITDEIQKGAGIGAGDVAQVELEVTKEWPAPIMQDDFAKALAAAPQKVKDKWKDITPMARYEWVRWINETKNPDTRLIRIQKTVSKLNGKYRRPCCFNLAGCTDPEVSKSGFLIDPSEE